MASRLPWSPTRPVLVVLALTVVTVGAGVWGGLRVWGDRESDALYPVGDWHRLCVPSVHSRTFTEGFDAFGNRGPAPVTIDRVEWPTTGDVVADSIQIFRRQPGDRFAALGIVTRLPQHLTGSPGRAWHRSVPADGATLELADPEGGGYLLVPIGVRGTKGTGGPLTLHYTDAEGHAGTVSSRIELRIAPKSCDGPGHRTPSGRSH